MKKYVTFALSALLAVGTMAPALAKGADQMTLVSYNIRNLFDGIPNPENTTGWKEKAKPEKELKALSQVIHKLNADVIAFQEVESLKVLTAFQKKYLQRLGYHAPILIEGNDRRGIDVALMSRFKVLSVKNYKDRRFSVPSKKSLQGFSRDLLQVKLEAPNHYTFSVFVAHLKSKYGGKKTDKKRKAEAREMYRILNRFHQGHPKANFVLMGDFNDTPKSGPLKPLLRGQGALKLQDITARDLGIRPRVYTYHPKKYRSRIDYILVSPGMMPEYKKNSVHIYKSKAALKASDHLPLVARFKIGEDR